MPEDDDLQLRIAQYQLVRAESDQARREQQSILTWNEAFAVASFAVGALAVGAQKNLALGRVIFGLIIPMVLTGGALAWAGELIRMERTAVYLRGLERSFWKRSDKGIADPRWFMWENLLWRPPERLLTAGYSKQSIGYVGVALFYSTMFIGSLIVFWAISPTWMALPTTICVVAASAIGLIVAARRVYSVASITAFLDAEELSRWANELPDSMRPEAAYPSSYGKVAAVARLGPRVMLRLRRRQR